MSMGICQRGVVLLSIVWILNSLQTSTAWAFGGIRNGIGNGNGRLASSLRVSGIESASSKGVKSRKKTAVVVGAGPGGLAAALVLSTVKKPGNPHDEATAFFDRVIVLDEEPDISYDVGRSYFFNINRRGQRFTDAFNIDLSKRGTPASEFAVQYVPSDPKDVFDGTNPSVQLMTDKERENLGTMYWIPRHELLELVTDEIHAKNNEKNSGNAIIEFRRGVSCQYIEPTADDLVKIVIDNKHASKEDVIVADLCVGADGRSSRVRQSLEDGRFTTAKWTNTENPSENFGLKKYISPATGLRIKGLRIDSKFAIPKGGIEGDSKSEIPIEPRYHYSLMSTTKGPTDMLRLSIFPQNAPDPASGRPINTITLPSHDLWNPDKIRTDDGGRSVKAYFQKVQPRFDWDKIVEEDEWERFASSKGSIFPPCQYSPSMYASPNPSHRDGDDANVEEDSGAGVVLVGDALHCFPPDLGQGVNMALEDAMMLGKAFEEARTSSAPGASSTEAPTSFVSKALKSYQEKNGPETRAIIALARCGAPFQYRQATTIMKFKKILWQTNIVLRILLNKVTNGFSPKPAIMLMMDPSLSFHQVMKKANTLTAVLWSVLFGFLLSLIRSRIKI